MSRRLQKTKVKLRAIYFKKAAELIKHALETDQAWTCCAALNGVMQSTDYKQTPEYKFFKKMFCHNRHKYSYWFGRPQKWIGNYHVPHPVNQQKRINALMKAYKAARRHNES